MFSSDANLLSASLSPDGLWIAYASDETNQSEVYVRPFEAVDSGKWQVSTEGGYEPVWSPTGRELFFRGEGGNTLFAVDVWVDGTFRFRKPKLLFTGSFESEPYSADYDVQSDGQRFLMLQSEVESPSSPEIVFVINWFQELKRLVPTE